MLIPIKNRGAVYELPFKKEARVAEKEVHTPKHPELVNKDIPNLHGKKTMKRLMSSDCMKGEFAWRHFYWILTN
ncbi:Putative 40S ribosomal protein S10-like [Lemmus lemmus]